MQKTAIIVPCYNEAKRLCMKDFTDYTKANKSVSFILVNDGSTDSTREKVDELCQYVPSQIYCVHLSENSGKAEAVRQGFLIAMAMDFENIGYWDADLSTPLSAISKFCQLLNCNNILIVMGARVKLLGRKIERQLLRHYLGRIFATFASFVLGIPVYDTQCGAKLFKNSSELKMVFSQPFTVKWIFDVEILARFITITDKRVGCMVEESIVEYPLETWTHMPGSKIKIRDFFIAPIELFKIYLKIEAKRFRGQLEP